MNETLQHLSFSQPEPRRNLISFQFASGGIALVIRHDTTIEELEKILEQSAANLRQVLAGKGWEKL